MVVPAGLMQFPMFNRHRPKYMGYGGLGSLVGEEVFATINDRGMYKHFIVILYGQPFMKYKSIVLICRLINLAYHIQFDMFFETFL